MSNKRLYSIEECTAILRGAGQHSKNALLLRDLIDEDVTNIMPIETIDTIGQYATELALYCSRVNDVVCTVNKLQEQLNKKDQPINVVSDLNHSLVKASQYIDSNIAKIKSITKTIAALSHIGKLFKRGVDVTHD